MSFLPFFIILFASVIFSALFDKLHLPWVVALIVAGIVFGPHGINLLQVTPTLEFFGEAGLVFLMFMAGLDTQLSQLKQFQTEIVPLAFINGFIPFLIGLGLGFIFHFPITTNILIGIIFVSSSIAIVIPTLESHGILQTKLGQAIMATSILQDVASLILLSIFLQTERPLAHLPLYLFYPLLILLLIGLKYIIPFIENLLIKTSSQTDRFQTQIRATLLVLFGTVIIFEALGLHSIIAGFFTGMVLSHQLQSEALKQKIRTLSYGVFIPTFFIIVGLETNLSIIYSAQSALLLTFTIVLSSIISKYISGFLGSLLVGFNQKQASLFAAASIPQLSTTLAATFTAMTLGLLSPQISTALILLSLFTTLIGPTLMSLSVRNVITATDLTHT